MVKAMLLAQGLWSEFLWSEPSTVGSWKSSLRWAFLSNFKTSQIHALNDTFMASICREWDVVKFFLIRIFPFSNEEVLRQPLIWIFFSD